MKCVMELLEEDGTVPFTASADWVNEVDRGGLRHVREGTYMLFSAMEEEVREHFQMGYVRDMKEDCKEKITAAVKDDDVLFHWCMLTTETTEDDAQEVLEMLYTCGLPYEAIHSLVHGWKCTSRRKRKAYSSQRLSEKD